MILPLLGELEVLLFGYVQHPVVSPVTALPCLEERMTLMNANRTWKCPDCGTTTEISYDWLAANGGPICGECDSDMELEPEATDR